jgi:hypothetical protein
MTFSFYLHLMISASFILIIIQVSSGKDGSKKDVIMVDPVEAKRLAAKQMERIKAKEKLKVK